jgi:DNA (cytosine-5)-methyltransferase 1
LEEFRLGELFCGPGGLARGADEAGDSGPPWISHAWATDIDPDACATYRANICKGGCTPVICSDVRDLDMASLGPIDALAFGFPCNDFSNVGEKRGIDGEYGPLYQYGVKALELFRPMWFLAENVAGLRASDGGKAFRTILGALNSAGYRLTPHLYRFEDYGVPQARHRIIIAGIRDDLDFEFRVPSPELRRRTDNSSRSALENPPIPPHCPDNVLTVQSPLVVRRLMHIKPGENAFTADLPDDLKLNVKGATISLIYRRLDPDKPAYTVTGSGGGGTHVYHWSEPRALTNRERARLQTFPDDFVFRGSKDSVRRQIGMAVPVEGARIIFEAMLRTFGGADYPHVPPNIDADPVPKRLGGVGRGRGGSRTRRDTGPT